MPTKPTYGAFTTRRTGNGNRDFLRGLKEGEPTKITAGFNIASLRSDAPKLGRDLGCAFSFRTIDGEAWICRLKPEDAK